jgi:hypothetical protein
VPAFKATHKTGAIAITSSASSLELVAILSLLVFVIGKEFIGQTQDSSRLQTLHKTINYRMVYHHFPCHPSNAKLVCDMPAISLQKFDLIMLEEVMVLFDMGYFIKKFVHKIILLYFKWSYCPF